jgi:hypothetical protein
MRGDVHVGGRRGSPVLEKAHPVNTGDPLDVSIWSRV